MKRLGKEKNKGFTIIEVIITMVVAAILATMMFSYTNMSSTKGSSFLTQTTKTFALQKVMENIFTDYNINYKTNLTGIQTAIGGGVAGGNEGATLNNSYGQYTIVYNHFIKFVGDIETPIDVDVDPQNILNVTIKNDLGETLSILLTLIVT